MRQTASSVGFLAFGIVGLCCAGPAAERPVVPVASSHTSQTSIALLSKCVCSCQGETSDASTAEQCHNSCWHASAFTDHGSWSCATPQPKTTKGTIFPHYEVVAIEYTPPGSGSEVDYGEGSTIGSRVELKSTFKAGVTLSVEGTVSGDAESLAGASVGTSFEFKRATGTSTGVKSQTDPVDHTKDVLLVWTNPAMTFEVQDNDVKVTMGTRDDAQAVIVPLTVAELMSPGTIPESKKASLTNLSPDDFEQMLSLDPLARRDAMTDPTIVDKARFTYVTTYELFGPDRPTEPVLHSKFTTSATQELGVSVGLIASNSVAFGVESGFDFFGIAGEKLKVGGKIEWEYEGSVDATKGTETSAELQLETETVLYHNVVDVYLDQLFGTFVFRQQFPPKTGQTSIGDVPMTCIDVTVLKGGSPVPGALMELEGPLEGPSARRLAEANSNGIVHWCFLQPKKNYKVHLPKLGGGTLFVVARPNKTASVKINAP